MIPNPLWPPPIGLAAPGLMASNRFPPPFGIPPMHPAGNFFFIFVDQNILRLLIDVFKQQVFHL